MVKGIDISSERFRFYPDSLVLIGGAACDGWFSRLSMTFRATRDLDIVLILEAVHANFVAALRGFIDEGGYAIRERSAGSPPDDRWRFDPLFDFLKNRALQDHRRSVVWL